jgi:MFS family permease
MSSDLFPITQRASVTSVYALGASAGSMAGSFFGGRFSDAYGWRRAFLVLAIPGVLLAGLVPLTVNEPARGSFDRNADVEKSCRRTW